MKILITGANGFIGKKLCEVLLRAGHKVKAGTRNKLNQAQWLSLLDTSLPQVTTLFDSENFELCHIGDITSSTDWKPHLINIDIVIHLAARVHVMDESQYNHENLYQETNVNGTKHLAQNAASAGVKQFIFLSSIKVNGDETLSGKPFSKTSPTSPNDHYGISKKEAEKALTTITRTSTMTYTIIRPALVYGPGVKANFLALLHLVQYQIPLPLKSIKNVRSMIYIENLASLIMHTISHESAYNQIFLAADSSMSTSTLITKIAKHSNKKVWLFYLPPKFLKLLFSLQRKKNISQRLLNNLEIDTTPLKNELCWEAPVKEEDAIKRTVEWFLKQ